MIVPFWIVILPNGSRLFFYPKPSFFTLNPVFYPKLSFFSVWPKSEKAKCLKSQCRKNFTSRYILYIFCIYFVYILYIPTTSSWLGWNQASIIWTPRSRCGLEIRLPIPLKRAEARFCLSRFPTFAVQKNCTGLNPAYQSAEARFCSIRLQKSWNM